MIWRILIPIVIVVLAEYYFFQSIKIFSQDFSPSKKSFFYRMAWILLILTISIMIAALIYPPPFWHKYMRMFTSVIFILMICKVMCIIWMLPEDLVRFGRWVYQYFQPKLNEVALEGNKISRTKFISQLALTFTVIPFAGFVYGMLRGAYKYTVHNVKVDSPNLPEAFNGFKIVQISDMHTGSFMSTEPIKKAFEIIMQQKADLILFTGDLVNNEAKETDGFIEEYKTLKAPYGVYSVLGNHDYGDYSQWPNEEDKKVNFEALKKVHSDSGWRLLMNEHVPLEKNGEKIALIGIENWGGSNYFRKYGKMHLAYKGAEEYPFKILMSHDPSHWDQQVRKEYPDVDLTLSGHTHGMQFGIEIPGFKWSPVQYLYKQWAGLYKQDNQYLYVNRGLGFLGYPGRLGIWPEITVIELHKV